jgi:flagellar hook protein FlgE
MMRSMYSAVSGLKNHQTRMDVIGNNIANVNTTGFKKSRVVFKDSLYQSLQGASRATGDRGGTNPMAIGLGMTLSSVDQIHTPSTTTYTNKTTDLAIDGNGYFVVESAGETFYSRAGNFDFDEWGNFVNTSNGYRVMGWMADKDGIIDTVKECQAIDISALKSVPPNATTQMRFTGNLNSNIGVNYAIDAADDDPIPFDPDNDDAPVGGEAVITSKDVYDALGNKHTVYFRFFKAYTEVDTDGELSDIKWYCDISLDPEFTGSVGTDIAANTVRQELGFDLGGYLTGPKSINLVIERTPETNDINFDIDLSRLTQWESKSTAWAEFQDGYTMGSLTSFTIGQDGTIMGVYDNGETKNLARVALANFQNPSGLTQVGNSLFQVSNNSGDPLIGAPGDEGMGAVLPSSLEMSNVDLSEEFTDMIVTQRGFQANSRIITTSDEMLQELVNLKR